MVGELDGVHLGHRHLVRCARQLAARHGRPVVAVVLDAANRDAVLMSPDERVTALLALGVDGARVLHLPHGSSSVDQIAPAIDALSPGPVVLSCPPPIAGDDRRYPSLAPGLRRRGTEVVEVERITGPDRRVITSARIRDAVRSGDVRSAADALGARFALTAEVARGQQLGRTIGFPTANLVELGRTVLPANGVYAATVDLDDGRRCDAAVNVGLRPTVIDTTVPIVEAHLLDFDEDLYDRRITVRFVDRLRDERRFEGLDALTAQLGRDVEHVRRLRPSQG